ncbi:FMN-binding protein [Mycoplasmatota bacterium]|nr:FMN-binding protein [Mycoplasmatota bacterium]
MSKNLKLMLFILILGTVTSVLLLGTYKLTEERIAQNADIKLRSAVLDGFGIDYTTSNINEIFEEDVDVIVYESTDGDITFYVDSISGAISFEYSGGGVWDTIYGVLTLESDLVTIRKVAVLEQAETPGLGGVVATAQYLETFEGILMTPMLEINKDDSENADNEVDTITGATRTSKAFEDMLNSAYTYAMVVWDEQGYGGNLS